MMRNLTQLIAYIIEETNAGRSASISEEELAEAVNAPADAKIYSAHIRAGIERICQQNDLRVQENFDKATFVFRQL